MATSDLLELPPEPDDPDGMRLVDSVNESAKHVTTVTTAFLFGCIYIGIMLWSTSHELLVRRGEIKLVPFNAGFPLVDFYILTPVILLYLHLYLLLQEYFLFHKMLPWRQQNRSAWARQFYPALPVAIMFGSSTYHWSILPLLQSVRLLINVVLPLGLLIVFQVQFLPYHSPAITSWHRTLVVLDLFLVLYFRWIYSTRLHATEQKDVWFRVRRLASLCFVLLVAYFCAIVAVVPGTMFECFSNRQFWPFDMLQWPIRNLTLRGRHLKGLVLVGRDLRHADFTGASLANADFRSAHLENAILTNADLRGAKFMPYGGFDGRFEVEPGVFKRRLIEEAHSKEEDFSPTYLEGADLRGARLQGANLILARLRKAKLSAARLAGVELTYADLRGAEMAGAQMPATELWHAQLQGADLTAADLRAASLELASLGGANLTDARLAAANLRSTDLSGARLTHGDLLSADLRFSQMLGANLRGAFLAGAEGLQLKGVNLRQSIVDAICQPRGSERPYLVDFREIEFLGNSQGRGSVLNGVPSGRLYQIALLRLIGPFRTTCPEREEIWGDTLRHRGLLYHDADRQRVQFMTDWPPAEEQRLSRGSTWGEDDYYKELVDLLMEEVCRNPGLALGLARDATEENTLEPEFQAHLKERLGARVQELEKAEIARKKGEAVTVPPCKPLLDLPAKTKAKIVERTAQPAAEGGLP